MDDLYARAEAFLGGPYILGHESYLISRYVRGELRDDSEALNLVSTCLQSAQIEAAKGEGATSGPERDALHCYQRMAELLEDIQAELLARPPR